MPIEIQQLSHVVRDQATQEAYLDSLRNNFDIPDGPIVPIEAPATSTVALTDTPNMGDLVLQGFAKVTQYSTHAVNDFHSHINTLSPNLSIGDCIDMQLQIMHFSLTHDVLSKVAGMSANAISTLFRNQ